MVCLYNINEYYRLLKLQLEYMVNEGFMLQEQYESIFIVQNPEELLKIIRRNNK